MATKSLNVRYVGDASQLKRVLGEIGGANTGLVTQLRSTWFATAAAFTAAAAGIGAVIHAYTGLGAEVRSVQRVTGLAAEDASRLIFVANNLGISVDDMSRSFGLLDKNIVNGTQNFTKYGIVTRNSDGSMKSLVSILSEAADKYTELGGGIQGAALAMNLFGRGGKVLIPILKQGSEGLKEMMAEADRFGVVLSQKDVDATYKFNIAVHELGASVKGLEIGIAQGLVPALTTGIHFLTGAVLAVAKIPSGVFLAVGALATLTTAILLVKKVSGILSAAWAPLVGGLKNLVMGVYGYVAALVSLAATEGIAATAAYVLDTALVAITGPVGLVIGGIGLLAGAVLVLTGRVNTLRDVVVSFAQPLVLIAQAQVLARDSGISFAAALAIVQARANGTVLSLKALQQQAAASVDLTAPLTPDQVAQFTGLTETMSAGFTKFATISGQSTSSIESDWSKMVSDTKNGGVDVLATLTDMQAAWKSWHDTIVANFGGAGSAMDEFANKSGVDLGTAIADLKTYQDQIHRFGADTRRIHAEFGSQANDFINWAQSQGLAQAGLVHAVATGSAKMSSAYIENWNKSKTATNELASAIENTLGKQFKTLIDLLSSIAVKMGLIPPPKVDTSKASGALDDLKGKVQEFRDGFKRPAFFTVKERDDLSAIATRMRSQGFHLVGSEWVASGQLLLHTRPSSPWPDEAIAASMHRAGFALQGSEWVGRATLELHTEEALRAGGKTLSALGSLVSLLSSNLKNGFTQADVESAKHWEHMEKTAVAALQHIEDKFKTFKEGIRAGFASVGDLASTLVQQQQQYESDLASFQQAQSAGTLQPGQTAPSAPDFSATIAQQVAAAQSFAADLQAAASKGLSQQLVSQFAGQGVGADSTLKALLANPELIKQLNDASEAIAKAAGQTANALGDQFFGAELHKASAHLTHVNDQLSGFVDQLKNDVKPSLKDLSDALDQLATQIANMGASQSTAAGANGASGGGSSGGAGAGGGSGSGAGGNGSGGGGGGGNPWDHWNPWQPPPAHGHQAQSVTFYIHETSSAKDTAREVQKKLLELGRFNGGHTGIRE